MKFLLLFVLHRGPGVARRSGEVHFDRRRRDTPVILPRPLGADDPHVSRHLLLEVALSGAKLPHNELELIALAAESVAILRHVLQVAPVSGKFREFAGKPATLWVKDSIERNTSATLSGREHRS